MKNSFFYLVVFFTFLSSIFSLSAAQEKDESFEGKVVEIKIDKEDLGNSQSFKYMKRIITRAEDEKAAAIVLTLDTPGGKAFETSEFMMRVLQPTKIPTYAFVNTQAMSAGALIAASCKEIYMAPVSSIGAAGLVSGTGEPIEEMARKKLESAFRSFTRSVVTELGHNPAVIDAMMVPADQDRTFGPVLVKKGELLTLTGKEAVEIIDGAPLLAKGLASSVQEILDKENISAPIVVAEPTGFEQIAWWIAALSPILILIGIGGIYIEFKTPGFGIGGIIAIVAFALFFFGNNIAGNLAGYETIALFLVGCILVCVEIFLFPGMIVFGAIGVICLVSAVFGGMIDAIALEKLFSEGGFTAGNLLDLSARPLLNLTLGLLGGLILIALLMKYLPNWALFKGFTNADISGADVPAAPVEHKPALKVGDIGKTLTELRPSGTAIFNDVRYEVVARDGYQKKGITVKIIKLDTFNVIVEQTEETELPAPSAKIQPDDSEENK